MNIVLKDRLPELSKLMKQYKVKKAFAFGSVTNDTFNKDSDIDIVIDFEEGIDPIEYGENYFKILYALQDLLKRDVDLITERSLRNPFFIKSVNQTKVPIYES